jgi:ABC-type branched-subunit amino acid transport system substrate-binding protein
MRRAEGIRLVVAVAAAAGVVALGESLSHGSHSASGSSGNGGTSKQALAGGSQAHHGGSGGAASSGQSANSANVTVAGGPAVARALRHGSMTVVIDSPPRGLFSEQNRSIAQGASVAVDALNASGGLPGHVHVKLVSENLDGLSASALQGRLRSQTAAALILPCDTDSQLSLAAAGSQFGMLMLAPCNPDPTAGGRYPTYWAVGTAANEETAGLASFMATLGYGSAFVVSSPGSRYVELLTSDFRNAAQSSGIKLAGSGSISMSNPDYASLARSIEAVQPRPAAIFTALPPPLVNRLAAGLRAEAVDETVLGSTAMDTPLTLSGGASSPLEDATFASYGFPRVSSSARRFAAAYRSRFRHEPVGSFPGLGLETIRLLEAAARKGHSPAPSAIQRALAGGITLTGVGLAARSYKAGGDHNPIGEVAISKVSTGSLLPLQAITLKTPQAP